MFKWVKSYYDLKVSKKCKLKPLNVYNIYFINIDFLFVLPNENKNIIQPTDHLCVFVNHTVLRTSRVEVVLSKISTIVIWVTLK